MIQHAKKHHVEIFLKNAGSSLEKFRYFKNRTMAALNNHLCTFLYYSKNYPTGYCHLDVEDGKLWLGICVSENYTNMGIGRKMMDRLMEEFNRQKNYNSLHLTVDKDNSSAIHIYKSYGFEIDKNYDNHKHFMMRIIK